MDPLQLAREASISTFLEMQSLLKEAIHKLRTEKEKSKIGIHKLKGGLVELSTRGRAIVVGDLHGDLESLITVLSRSQFMKKTRENETYLVFLGDYGDRGEETLEVYWVVLKLKLIFPENVVLLRGNHEGPPDLGVHPFDLPYFLRQKYGPKWQELFPLFPELFNTLPYAVFVPERYLLVHGGLPVNISSIEDIEKAFSNHPTKDHLTQILWNDPGEIEGFLPSPRGAGVIFGRDVSENILKKLKVKTLIRSHEPCNGVMVAHQGKVLTLFSRKGAPYYNDQAAYLTIDLSAPAKDAFQLAREAHLF